MTLEQRLERLERENRWMRRIGVAGAALAFAVLLPGQGTGNEPSNLDVRSLVVRDKSGTPRVRITDSGVSLLDEHQKAHIGLGVFAALAGLVVWDRDGHARASVVLDDDGPAVAIKDASGKTRAVLGVGRNTDAQGGEIKTPEGSLTLYDAAENVTWHVPK